MNNRLDGGDGNDALRAEMRETGEGLFTSTARNLLDGDAIDDRLRAVMVVEASGGAEAANTLRGGDGDDALLAEILYGPGASRLHGGAGDDRPTAVGGGGNVLYGGRGEDVRRSAAEADTFVFDLADLAGVRGAETILGFDPAVDRLAFFGVTDVGAPGLVDDLDAVFAIDAGDANGDVVVRFERGSVLFRGSTAEDVGGVADLVADAAAQLAPTTPDMIA